MRKWQIRQLQELASEIVLKLPEWSPLRCAGEGGGEFSLGVDRSIFPHVVRHFEWQLADQAAAMTTLPAGREYHLIDIGANIGLFTRQAMARFPLVRSASCFEPAPDNLRHLRRNLAPLPAADIHAFGLHAEEGTLTFHIDHGNAGNCSFNPAAVAGRPHSVVEVPIRRLDDVLFDELLRPEQKSRRLIWKSDTQGLDELLMTQMSDDFWSRVDLVFFEGWRVEKPEWDRDRLAAIIGSFPHAYQKPRGGMVAEVGAVEIIDYLGATDRRWSDFLLTRAPLALPEAA